MITVDTQGGGHGATVQADGPLTIEAAEGLRAALITALDRDADVTADLSGAEELDLACMQVLLAARKACSAAGGTLTIKGLPEGLGRAVRDAGLTGLTTAA
ncbi:MAG: STAS domain-containing protein [Nitrospirae bacterium]|nr:STAS domain-containing protein [Nitrospirota bacterium]MBI5696805.1 STAS domain-containing protein [Nitrospirota bacterium]